eukprot:gene5705-32092_t
MAEPGVIDDWGDCYKTKAFNGDARMMTVFDKTVMNMEVCETDKGEKYMVPKYDSLLDPHLAYIMKAEYGVKNFLGLQDIMAISETGAALKCQPLMKLNETEGSALVYVPFWATGKNMMKQGAIVDYVTNALKTNTKLDSVFMVHGAYRHGAGFTIVDFDKMMTPGYMHYKCAWRRQKQWSRQMTPETKMDELIKQFADKTGLTPKLFDKYTLHLIVDPGAMLPKDVKDVVYFTADRDQPRRPSEGMRDDASGGAFEGEYGDVPRADSVSMMSSRMERLQVAEQEMDVTVRQKTRKEMFPQLTTITIKTAAKESLIDEVKQVMNNGVEMKLVNGSAYIQAGTAKQVNKAKETLAKYAPVAEWRAQMWKDCEAQKLPAAWAAVDNDRPQTPRARDGGEKNKSPDTAEKQKARKKQKGQQGGQTPPKEKVKEGKGAGRGTGR